MLKPSLENEESKSIQEKIRLFQEKIRLFQKQLKEKIHSLLSPNFRKDSNVIKKYGWKIKGEKYLILIIPINNLFDKDIKLEKEINITFYFVPNDDNSNHKKPLYEKKDIPIRLEKGKEIILVEKNEAQFYNWKLRDINLYKILYDWQEIFLNKNELEIVFKKILWINFSYFSLEEENKYKKQSETF